MIAYLNGTIIEKEPTNVIIDVNGVGYMIYISLLDFNQLPLEGESVHIHTYLYVKEDILKLYGSLDKEVLKVFEKLISISGIGPKVAMGILSFLDITNLIMCILNDDINTLSKCPGIGKKTAQKIILELKDKFKNYNSNYTENNITLNNNITKKQEEAVDALITLGYNKKQSEKIVKDILKEQSEISIEELIRNSLKALVS